MLTNLSTEQLVGLNGNVAWEHSEPEGQHMSHCEKSAWGDYLEIPWGSCYRANCQAFFVWTPARIRGMPSRFVESTS